MHLTKKDMWEGFGLAAASIRLLGFKIEEYPDQDRLTMELPGSRQATLRINPPHVSSRVHVWSIEHTQADTNRALEITVRMPNTMPPLVQNPDRQPRLMGFELGLIEVFRMLIRTETERALSARGISLKPWQSQPKVTDEPTTYYEIRQDQGKERVQHHFQTACTLATEESMVPCRGWQDMEVLVQGIIAQRNYVNSFVIRNQRRINLTVLHFGQAGIHLHHVRANNMLAALDGRLTFALKEDQNGKASVQDLSFRTASMEELNRIHALLNTLPLESEPILPPVEQLPMGSDLELA